MPATHTSRSTADDDRADGPDRNEPADAADSADSVDPSGSIDPDAAWAAVEARDRESDGRFVLAVTTTGIYCRPWCPARRPRRENVRFYAGPGEAEAAGFRACKRCRPADAGPDPGLERVLAARAYLEQHLDETVTLERLAGEVGGSAWHLQRSFKRRFGLSPRQYVNQRRLERLRDRLRNGGDDVTTAMYDAGFTSASQLYQQSDARLGMSPGRYRKGGDGAAIRFAVAPSPAGRLLVAATERGVCAVKLGDRDAELEAELRREFPRASIEPAEDAMTPWIDAVVRRVEGSAETPPPPLDLGGTAFQRLVWQALTEIPPGATVTYGELAARLGRPTAARAVARACATNPVAVVVPCHRVVAADGGLGGYRWGTERKRRLLAGERERAAGPAAG
jgi:AraC family transcriptional regulator of adaptative response/methylated-DNA-[protein]-cysteine methyltransferase